MMKLKYIILLLILGVFLYSSFYKNPMRLIKREPFGKAIFTHDYFTNIDVKEMTTSGLTKLICDVDLNKYDKYISSTYSTKEVGEQLSNTILSKWDNSKQNVQKLYAEITFEENTSGGLSYDNNGNYKLTLLNGKECSTEYGFVPLEGDIIKNVPYSDMLDLIVMCSQDREPSLTEDVFNGIIKFGKDLFKPDTSQNLPERHYSNSNLNETPSNDQRNSSKGNICHEEFDICVESCRSSESSWNYCLAECKSNYYDCRL